MTRRRMLSSGKEAMYAVTAADSPQLMQILYDKGIAANPSYITTKEAAKVTNEQLARLKSKELAGIAEPFDGFRFFKGVTELPDGLFYDAAFTTLAMPENVRHVSANAFRQLKTKTVLKCPLVERVDAWCCYFTNSVHVWGDKLMSIPGDYTFAGNIHVFLGATPPVSTNTHQIYSTRAVYVPDESLEAYKSATGFSEYSNRIHPISEYPNPEDLIM